jgi:hypothetical protein
MDKQRKSDKCVLIVTAIALFTVVAMMLNVLIVTGYFDEALTHDYICTPAATDPICGNKGCSGDNVIVHGKVAS